MDSADKQVSMSSVTVYSVENLCQFQRDKVEKLKNSKAPLNIHTY